MRHKADWLEQVWMEVQDEIDLETRHPQPCPIWIAVERADQEDRLRRFHPLPG